MKSRDWQGEEAGVLAMRCCMGENTQPRQREASSDLVLLALLVLAAVLQGLGADLLVVLLEGSKVLTGLGELTLLHTLADVPVDERTLGVHEVELVVEAGQHLRDGGGVGDHAHGAHHLGEVAARHNRRGLVVDADLEAARRPVDELDRALGLDGGDGGVDVLRDDVAAVQKGTRAF